MTLVSVVLWLEQRWTAADGMQYFWKEKAAFSLSTAVLFSLAHKDPKLVRGVLGRLIYRVLQ